MSDVTLRYVGDGAWFPGVPMRDLTADDLERFAADADALVKSGVYARSGVKMAPGANENKMAAPAVENKEQ